VWAIQKLAGETKALLHSFGLSVGLWRLTNVLTTVHGYLGIDVYSGLIDPSFRVIDPSAGGNNPEGRSLLNMQ